MNIKELKILSNNNRKRIIDTVYLAQTGHVGGSLSIIDMLTAIYELDVDLTAKKRSKVVLSKGHTTPALYAVLNSKGIIRDEEMGTFRKINSRLQGHPSMRALPGVDMSTGSLGQGISCAVGMALANKLDKNDHRIYTLCGDGECQEGQVWEAIMAAAHHKLDNLCIIIDNNNLQIDGKVEDVMSIYPLNEKMKAFNCHVIEIDGHDFDQIRAAFKEARETKGQPTVIIAKTIKGKGVSFMENQAGWHGVAPNEEQYHAAIKELEAC